MLEDTRVARRFTDALRAYEIPHSAATSFQSGSIVDLLCLRTEKMNWKLVASSGAPSFALGGISGSDCVVLLRILILLVDVEEHGKSGLISCCEGQDESRNRWKSDQCTIEIPAGSRFAYSFNPADLAPEVPGKKLTSAYEGASSHHLVPSRVT
jgi:hypothetical protein